MHRQRNKEGTTEGPVPYRHAREEEGRTRREEFAGHPGPAARDKEHAGREKRAGKK